MLVFPGLSRGGEWVGTTALGGREAHGRGGGACLLRCGAKGRSCVAEDRPFPDRSDLVQENQV